MAAFALAATGVYIATSFNQQSLESKVVRIGIPLGTDAPSDVAESRLHQNLVAQVFAGHSEIETFFNLPKSVDLDFKSFKSQGIISLHLDDSEVRSDFAVWNGSYRALAYNKDPKSGDTLVWKNLQNLSLMAFKESRAALDLRRKKIEFKEYTEEQKDQILKDLKQDPQRVLLGSQNQLERLIVKNKSAAGVRLYNTDLKWYSFFIFRNDSEGNKLKSFVDQRMNELEAKGKLAELSAPFGENIFKKVQAPTTEFAFEVK